MGMLFTGLAVWPFVEAWLTGDKSHHNILDRPRNAPTRTALGVAGMTFYGLMWAGGGNDIIATQFNVSLNAVTWFLRIAVFVGPVIAFIVTKRLCLSLQRADRERVLHGSESGIIVRSPAGGYHEPHAPISNDEAFTLTQHRQYDPLEATPTEDEHGVRIKDKAPSAAARPPVGLVPPATTSPSPRRELAERAPTTTATREEIADAHHHDRRAHRQPAPLRPSAHRDPGAPAPTGSGDRPVSRRAVGCPGALHDGQARVRPDL